MRRMWWISGGCLGIALVGVVWAVGAGSWVPAAPGRGSPGLSISETEIDFGPVRQYDALRHTFVLRNSGAAPVRLEVLKIGCNCLRINVPDAIPPQSALKLDVDVETRDREGPFSTAVVLKTSDPDRPVIPLVVRFYGVPDRKVVPSSLEFRDVRRGHILKAEMSIVVPVADQENENKESPPVVEARSPAVQCRLLGSDFEDRPIRVVPRRVYRYGVSVRTAELPNERTVVLADGLSLTGTRDGTRWATTVPIRVDFRHHDDLIGLTSITLQPGRTERRTVTVLSRDGEPFRLRSARVSGAQLDVTIDDRTACPRHEVSIALPPDFNPSWGAGISDATVQLDTEEWPDAPFPIRVLMLPKRQ